jgi:diguanylate cyclase (GGDEF)-like protein
MQLDSNTLIFSIGILSLLMGLISWSFPTTITDREFGLREWAAGIACAGVSVLLIFLRHTMPFWMGFILPNLFLMAASSLSLMAQCRFYDRPVPKGLIAALWAIGLIGLLGFFWLDWAVAWAMASVCFTMGTQLFASMVVIVRHARKPRPLAGIFLAVTLGVMSAGYWARFVWALFNLDAPLAPISLAGAHQGALVLGALFVVSSTMSFFAGVHDAQKQLIAERARRDVLTGLVNRRAFFEWADEWAAKGARYALLMIDIDHFKSINDRHGHLGGDAVLSHAGRTLLNSFRLEDHPARYGGEEFCVLLLDTSIEAAMSKAQALVERFRQETIRVSPDQQISITISVGVNDNSGGKTLLKTIQGADEALYQAKASGRDRAVQAG